MIVSRIGVAVGAPATTLIGADDAIIFSQFAGEFGKVLAVSRQSRQTQNYRRIGLRPRIVACIQAQIILTAKKHIDIVHCRTFMQLE